MSNAACFYCPYFENSQYLVADYISAGCELKDVI
jgi:hypothetical protein